MLDDGRVMVVDFDKVVIDTAKLLDESTMHAYARSIMRLFMIVRDPEHRPPDSAYFPNSMGP